MTLNEIFAVEKKEAILHNKQSRLTPEEQRQILIQYQEASGVRSEFYNNVAEQIDSQEQSNAVYSSISDCNSIALAVLKIRRMIKTGIAPCNKESPMKLDQNTIAVLEGSIHDFNRDTNLLALGSSK
mgnify:CR=1 FL=1